MRIKIFFSYSRVDRSFLDSVIASLGHDYAVVDNYVLEDGEEVWPEIKKAIEKSTHFVFLMSNAALQSNWCNSELGFVRDLYDNDEIHFLSFRIDENVDIENLGRKRWLKNIVSNGVFKPKMLARTLMRKIRLDVWKQFPEMEKKEKLFIGREAEMGKITHDYYENVSTCTVEICPI